MAERLVGDGYPGSETASGRVVGSRLAEMAR